MVVTENKRLSFKNAWRKRMNQEQQESFKNAYLNAGYAISTFYNDKNGNSNISEDRKMAIEKIAADVNVKNIWD